MPQVSDHKPVSSLFRIRMEAVPQRPKHRREPEAFFWELVEAFYFFTMIEMIAIQLPIFYREMINGATYWILPVRNFKTNFAFNIRDAPVSQAQIEHVTGGSNCVEVADEGCLRAGLPLFARSAWVCYNMFAWWLILNLLFIVLWSLLLFFQNVLRVFGGYFRRRFRWHGYRKETWWRYQGGIIRFYQMTYAPLITFGFYQLELASTVGDFWMLTLLAVLAILFFPHALFARKVYQLHWLKKKYDQWAVYKNTEIRLKFGCLFLPYRSSMSLWFLVKMLYLFLQSCVVGLAGTQPTVQLILLLVVELMYLAVLGYFHPYYDKFQQRVTIFIHGLRSGNLLVLFVFLPNLVALDVKDVFGYVGVVFHFMGFALLLGICVESYWRNYGDQLACCKDNFFSSGEMKKHKEGEAAEEITDGVGNSNSSIRKKTVFLDYISYGDGRDSANSNRDSTREGSCTVKEREDTMDLVASVTSIDNPSTTRGEMTIEMTPVVTQPRMNTIAQSTLTSSTSNLFSKTSITARDDNRDTSNSLSVVRELPGDGSHSISTMKDGKMHRGDSVAATVRMSNAAHSRQTSYEDVMRTRSTSKFDQIVSSAAKLFVKPVQPFDDGDTSEEEESGSDE